MLLVSRFAREVVQPKVREMDENELMDKSIINAMFENGVSVSPFYWHLSIYRLHMSYVVDGS